MAGYHRTVTHPATDVGQCWSVVFHLDLSLPLKYQCVLLRRIELILLYVQLKVPVHLNAAVIDGRDGLSDKQVVDGDLFLRSVMNIFPECTLSLSWVTDSSLARYNWTMVKAMYDLIDR